MTRKKKKPIYFYPKSKQYSEFSNFSLHRIGIDGMVFPSVEHYFHWAKFTDELHKKSILEAETPQEAKKLGASREHKLIPNWEKERIVIMRRALRAKFSQHPALREILFSTGERPLINDSQVDDFWGCGKDKKGKNMLGVLLMELREELQIVFQ